MSKFTGADNFGIPELTPNALSGEDAYEKLRSILRDLRREAGYGLDASQDDVATSNDPALELVAVIPELTIKPYAVEQKENGEDVIACSSLSEMPCDRFAARGR
jgi:hypothetical protein